MADDNDVDVDGVVNLLGTSVGNVMSTVVVLVLGP